MDFSRRQTLALLGAAALPPGVADAGPNDPTLIFRAGRIRPRSGSNGVAGVRPDGGFMLAHLSEGRIVYCNFAATGAFLHEPRRLELRAIVAHLAQPVILPDGVTMFSFSGALIASPDNPGVFTVQMSGTGEAITPVTRINVAGDESPDTVLAIQRSDRTALVAWQAETADGLKNVRWRIVGRSATTTGIQTVRRPSGRTSHTLLRVKARPNLAAALTFYRERPHGLVGQSYLQLIAPSGAAEGAQIPLGRSRPDFAVTPQGRIGVLWVEGNSVLCLLLVAADGTVGPVVRSVVDDVVITSSGIAANPDGYFVVTTAGVRRRPDAYYDYYERAHVLNPSGNLIQTLQVNFTPEGSFGKYIDNSTGGVIRLLGGDFVGFYRFQDEDYFQRLRLI